MINSRAKGAAAEREVANILNTALGSKLVRNLEQTRSGGHDLIDNSGVLDKYAIEVKRYAKITESMVVGFWQQCVEQAQQVSKEPVLIYKQNYGEWRVVVRMPMLTKITISPCFIHDAGLVWNYAYTATMSLPAFCSIVRSL